MTRGWDNRLWFPVDRGLLEHPVWQMQPDRDLWILLMRDAHTRGSDMVPFSYQLAGERLAYRTGPRGKVQTFTLKALKGALTRMVDSGMVRIPAPEHRRRAGLRGEPFPVTIVNFRAYRLQNRDATGQTPGQRAGQPSGQPAAPVTPPPVGDYESERPYRANERDDRRTEPGRDRGKLVHRREEVQPSLRSAGDDDHSQMFDAVWTAHEQAFGTKPRNTGGWWAKTFAELRGRGATLEQVRTAAVRFCELVANSEGVIPFAPSHFASRFGVLAGGTKKTRSRGMGGLAAFKEGGDT